MEINNMEYNELIATRKEGFGDTWVLVGEETERSSLTEALEAYFQNSEIKPIAYRLEPQNSKLFAIKQGKPEPPKRFNIYGDR
jgi:hypothetical protein